MLSKSVSALAVLALAAHVAAEENMPYKPLMKMSVHQMFGIGRRQNDGYQPGQSVCGAGNTCAEACGAGFVTCASSDSTVHCYNATADQTCCPDNSGNSCDAGYYCALGTTGETTCCPNGVDLASCAALMSVTGSLVSETPKPTTSSTSSSSNSSTSSVITTSSASANSTTFHAWNTTTTAMTTDTLTSCESTLTSSAALTGSNTTTTHKVPSVVASATPSPSKVSISGASTVGAAGALSLLAAAAIAALL